MPTAEEKAKAEEQQKRDAASAAVGAEAVAEAVKKAADAAVVGARSARGAAASGDFVVSGNAGGRFTIRGNGFTASGTVTLNGKQLNTTAWGNEQIEGHLPADAKSGEIVVWIDDKTQKRAYLGLP